MRRSQKGSQSAGSLIVENIIWLNVFKVTNYINGLVIGTWIIRSFNPNEIGMYGYAVAGSEIITSIAGLGVNLPLLRELKKKKEAEEELISAATMIYILSAIICYILFLLIGVQQERLELKLLVAITGIKILLAISNIYRIWYLSKIQSRVFVKAQVISLVIASSIKVIALTNGLSIVIVGIADITGLAAMTILLEAKSELMRKYVRDKAGKIINRKHWIILLKQGLPLMVSEMIITINLQMGTIMVKSLIGLTEAGIYLAALKIPTIIPGLLYSVEQTLMAYNLEKIEEGSSQIAILKKSNSPIIYISTCLAGAVCIFSSAITKLLFGANYNDSATIMATISPIIIMSSMTSIQRQYCLINDKNRDIVRSNLITLVSGLVLNIYLISRFGLLGAAAGTVISMLVGLIASTALDYEFANMLYEITMRPDFSYLKHFILRIKND